MASETEKAGNYSRGSYRYTDKEAARGGSQADGRVHGYGGFSSASHRIAVPGCSVPIKNSRNGAGTMRFETGHYEGLTDYVVTDSGAAKRDNPYRRVRKRYDRISGTASYVSGNRAAGT